MDTKGYAPRGKLVRDGGRYFIEVEGGLRQELTVGYLTDESQLEQALGSEVELTYTEPVRHIIAIQRTKPPLLRVLCYVPAVRWVEKSLMTDSAVIGRVAKAYLDAGVLTREQFNTITKDVKK